MKLRKLHKQNFWSNMPRIKKGDPRLVGDLFPSSEPEQPNERQDSNPVKSELDKFYEEHPELPRPYARALFFARRNAARKEINDKKRDDYINI